MSGSVDNAEDPPVRTAAIEAVDGDSGSRRAWLNRNVVGMGLTSLLSDAGHEMATAVLPAFLATLGVSAAALGAIEGVSDAVASFAKLGSGWWSDRIGHRKAIAVGGYALTGAAKALFAFAAGWPLVFTGRILAWFGRGIRGSLRDAMLVESVEPADVGKAFGFHRAGDTIGAVIGPLLGVAAIGLLHGRLADPSMPFRVVFLLTLIPGLGSAVAFALLVRERRRAPNHDLAFWSSIRSLPPDYRRFLSLRTRARGHQVGGVYQVTATYFVSVYSSTPSCPPYRFIVFSGAVLVLVIELSCGLFVARIDDDYAHGDEHDDSCPLAV